MEYIYAALLLHRLGKPITEESLKKVIEAAGVEPDEAKTKTVVASLKGVNIDEALKEAAAAPVPAAIPAAKPEEKKEERPEEAAEGLAALFG